MAAETTYTLHYWGIKARGYLPTIIASVGDLSYTWNKSVEWPAFKPNTPFGQLPVLTGADGFTLGQSLAIVRFLARKANLQGETDAEFARSEELIQEGEDLYMSLAKAHYTPDRTKAMDEFFATTLGPHKDALAKLLGDKTTFSGKLLAGDLAIFAIFDVLVALQADALDSHPTLKAFTAHVGANPKVKAAGEGVGMYFSRHTEAK